MCRIAGIINFTGKAPQEAAVTAMRDSMAHGGPDDAGFFVDGGVGLGHRRLSIIDLSRAANQPMKAAGRDVWITYNGEIYNFREIRRELEQHGHKFFSASDTEVIINAYLQWGEAAFSKFNGMFAFCLYDKKLGQVYLVRDHAGIKPLYYSISGERLVFASEIKAFRALDGNWSHDAAWPVYFLAFGHMPEPFTTLKGVFALPAGNFLKAVVKSGHSSIVPHSELKLTQEISDPVEAKDRVKELVSNSVERHLISDVPIGVFLSGGLDSSIIAIAAAAKTDKLHTLSIIFNEADYSEQKYQRLVSERTRSEHSEYTVTREEFFREIPLFMSFMDQPSIDGVNTWFISKYARKAGLKAVLSGLGADELFGGYSSFNRIGKLWPLRSLSGGSRAGFKMMRLMPDNRLRRLSYMALKSPLSFYLTLRGLFTPSEISRILSIPKSDVYAFLEKVAVPKQGMDELTPKSFASSIEAGLYMRNQLLKDTDFTAMAHSLEVRVPFLDKELMKYVFSINDSVKFQGSSKVLLREAFGDVLPPEILSRKKMGFTFPFGVWLRENPEVFKKACEKSGLNLRYSPGHWSKDWAIEVLSGWL